MGTGGQAHPPQEANMSDAGKGYTEEQASQPAPMIATTLRLASECPPLDHHPLHDTEVHQHGGDVLHRATADDMVITAYDIPCDRRHPDAQWDPDMGWTRTVTVEARPDLAGQGEDGRHAAAHGTITHRCTLCAEQGVLTPAYYGWRDDRQTPSPVVPVCRSCAAASLDVARKRFPPRGRK